MAADDTVILRDVAELQRVAADRVAASIREYHGDEVARLRRLVASLEHTLRQVRDERDGLREELEALQGPVFETIDDVSDWIRDESQRMGMRSHIRTGGKSRIVTIKDDTGLLILVCRPGPTGLVWIQKTVSRGMEEHAAEIAARGRFDVADSDYVNWCVGLIGGGAS